MVTDRGALPRLREGLGADVKPDDDMRWRDYAAFAVVLTVVAVAFQIVRRLTS